MAPWEEYQAAAVADPTATTALKPWEEYAAADTELPEVVATEGGNGLVAKVNEALRKPSPAWLQAPESALRELITEQLPHDLPSYLKSIGGPAVTAFEQGRALAGGDVSGIPLVGRVPEIIEADETPAFSKERYKTALKTLMDVGALAGAVEGPRVPLRAEPTLAERITQPRVEPVAPEPPPVPVEPPVQAPEIPVNAPEAVVPTPVAEAAPPAPAPVSPRAAKQLGKLKAYVEKSKKLGQQVDPKVTAKIAEIEGVPPEAPVQVISGEYQQGTKFSPLGDSIRRRINTLVDGPLNKSTLGHPQKGLPAFISGDVSYARDFAREQAIKYPDEAAKYNKIADYIEKEFPIEKPAPVSPEAPVQAQEAPSFASEAPSGVPGAEPESLTQMFSVKGSTNALYQKAFDALRAGQDTISGVRDPILARHKAAFNRGEIRSWEDLKVAEEGKGTGGITEEAAARAATETVRAAALRFPNGDITTGEAHGAAWEQADQYGLTGKFRPENVESGFVTSTGRFITAEEATKIKGKTSGGLDASEIHEEFPQAGAPPEVPPSERGYAGMEPLPPGAGALVPEAQVAATVGQLNPGDAFQYREGGKTFRAMAKADRTGRNIRIIDDAGVEQVIPQDTRVIKSAPPPIAEQLAPVEPPPPGAGAPEVPPSERGYAGMEPLPQKPSKIGQSIEAKAVEAKLTKGFPETAGYDPITIKDQAARATELVKQNPSRAGAIIRGEEPLPPEIKGTSLITAMEEHLLRNPSAQGAYELANSRLVSLTSEAAQEMRLMSERVPDGITAKFAEIKKAREEGAALRKETKTKVKKEINGEVVKAASKRPTWEQFVKEIVC